MHEKKVTEMKCYAIGDKLLPSRYFDEVLKSEALFESYSSYAFREDMDRNETRNMIRRMETEGSTYCEIPDEVMRSMADVEILFIHLFPVSAKLIEASKNLRYIVTARGGVENIDVACAKAHGITIINCPGHNAYAVAEYTIGLMLAETRNIVRADAALRRGQWREAFPNSKAIPELRACTVGIIGYGTIGRLVAERLQPFGCRIIVNDPYVRAEDILATGCTPVTKDELLQTADIVTLHGRLPAGEPPIIGQQEFEKMKPNSILINTARAALVDMQALENVLREKRIMGAAVDVFPKEPLGDGDPLLALDNIVLTNHRGGDTIDSYIKAPEMLLKQLHELLDTGFTRCMIR